MVITNTNNNLSLLSAYTYFVLGIVLSSLYGLIYLILTKLLQGRNFNLYSIIWETETCKIRKLASGRVSQHLNPGSLALWPMLLTVPL